jgi:multicomponent Na+:H+ antiporter subunit E
MFLRLNFLTDFLILSLTWFVLNCFDYSVSSLITLSFVHMIIFIFQRRFLTQSNAIVSINYLNTVKYFFWLISELFKSSVAVSRIAWRKNLAILPVTDIINSEQEQELARIILANSITLTPGTLTISLEGNKLLVHALDVGFMDDLKTGELDQKVKRLF